MNHTRPHNVQLTKSAAILGGSLGEVTKDAPFDQKFKDCAWDLEPSTVDKPKYNWVKTDFGYHIIMVEK